MVDLKGGSRQATSYRATHVNTCYVGSEKATLGPVSVHSVAGISVELERMGDDQDTTDKIASWIAMMAAVVARFRRQPAMDDDQ